MYTFFPDKYKHLDGSKLCQRFGGTRVDVSTRQKFEQVVAFLGAINDDPAYTTEGLDVSTFTMFTDEEEFNVWKNYETGEILEYTLDWFFAEPNGGMVENCAEIWVNPDKNGKWVGSWNDQTCNRPAAVACEGIREVILTLRGKTPLE